MAKSFVSFSQVVNSDQMNNAFVISLARIKNEFTDVIVRPLYPGIVHLVDVFSNGLVTICSSLLSKFNTLVDITYGTAFSNVMSVLTTSIQTRSDDLVTYLVGFLAKNLGESLVCFDQNINTAIISLQILAIELSQKNITDIYESFKLNATNIKILLNNCITSFLKTPVVLTAIKVCFQNLKL